MGAVICGVLSGCSVGMALSGEKEPEISHLKEGATLDQVELALGRPVKVIPLESGHTQHIYEYVIGNESSAGRAVGHGVMDVLTLGIWEVVGTPIEAINGDKYQVMFEFDALKRVVGMKKSHKNRKI